MNSIIIRGFGCLAAFILTFSSSAFAVEFSSVGRDSRGQVLSSLDQVQAEAYCLERGMLLPSLDQLLLYAHQNGACGTLTSPVYRRYKELSQCKKSQYLPVPGSTIYYSPFGYVCAEGALAHSFFWSRTPHPQQSGAVWQLSACTGLLDYAPPELGLGGVICVKYP